MLLANKVNRAALLNGHPITTQPLKRIAAPFKRPVSVLKPFQEHAQIAIACVLSFGQSFERKKVHFLSHLPMVPPVLQIVNMVTRGLSLVVSYMLFDVVAQVKAA